jgi:hypothetical protein
VEEVGGGWQVVLCYQLGLPEGWHGGMARVAGDGSQGGKDWWRGGVDAGQNGTHHQREKATEEAPVQIAALTRVSQRAAGKELQPWLSEEEHRCQPLPSPFLTCPLPLASSSLDREME